MPKSADGEAQFSAVSAAAVAQKKGDCGAICATRVQAVCRTVGVLGLNL